MHLMDRQTDRPTAFSSLVRVGIPCSVEKNMDVIILRLEVKCVIIKQLPYMVDWWYKHI